MANKIEKKVYDFIDSAKLLNKEQPFILAYSGGADSTALLYILYKRGYKFRAVHVNHNLRDNHSKEDALFTVNLCNQLNIPISVFLIDVKKNAQEQNLSIELAARNLRIQTLTLEAKKQNINTIATAHHKDDNAETVIQRLMRGTGYRGLCGIREQNNINQIRYVRPLLNCSKKQILQYLKDNHLTYCVDYTNFENIYTRNKIRNQIIPYIGESSSKDIAESIFKLSYAAVKFNSLLLSKANLHLKHLHRYFNFNLFDKELFISLEYPLKIELIRIILISLGLGERDINNQHYTLIAKIYNNNQTVNLPSGFFVKSNSKQIIFSKPPVRQSQLISVGKRNVFEDFAIDAEIFDFDKSNFQQYLKTKDNWTEYFDYEKIKGSLVIRPIKKGDTFTPLGKNKPRKIGDFCPSRAAAIISDEQNILWIASIRPSDSCKITETTKKVLKLTIQDSLIAY